MRNQKNLNFGVIRNGDDSVNKKIVIGIVVAFIVAMVLVAFFVVFKPQPKIDIRVRWFVWGLQDTPMRHKGFSIKVSNWGSEPVNLTGVEMVYLPNGTLGLVWIERWTIEPSEHPYGNEKDFGWYGWVNKTLDLPYVDPNFENTPEKLAFWNLLKEGEHKAILEITVGTTEGIYTFHPQESFELTKPTSIEQK